MRRSLPQGTAAILTACQSLASLHRWSHTELPKYTWLRSALCEPRDGENVDWLSGGSAQNRGIVRGRIGPDCSWPETPTKDSSFPILSSPWSNSYVCFCDCLFPLIIRILRSTLWSDGYFQSFLLLHTFMRHYLFYCYGYLGCFQIFAIASNVSENILVSVFRGSCVRVLWGSLLGMELLGCVRCLLHLIKSFPIVFHPFAYTAICNRSKFSELSTSPTTGSI